MIREQAGKIGRYILNPTPLMGAVEYLRHQDELKRWSASRTENACPHLLKQAVLRTYAARYSVGVYVETGTLFGEMTYAMRNDFHTLVTIELDPKLYRSAARRFGHCRHIRTVQGDSATALPRVVADLNEAALFWLDGHYSGGCTARGAEDSPVRDELRTILEHRIQRHVILVDDAREFTGVNGYPTIAELSQLAETHGREIEVASNIIRIVPK